VDLDRQGSIPNVSNNIRQRGVNEVSKDPKGDLTYEIILSHNSEQKQHWMMESSDWSSSIDDLFKTPQCNSYKAAQRRKQRGDKEPRNVSNI
jgi:hypothetical protein